MRIMFLYIYELIDYNIYIGCPVRPTTRITPTVLEIGRNAWNKIISRGASCDDEHFFPNRGT